MPFLPYMQSLQISKNELIQGLGILFVCITAALAAALVQQNVFDTANLIGGLFQGFPVSTSGSRTAVAEKAGVKHLVLTHLIPSPPNFIAKRLFLGGMSERFKGQITLGEDAMEIGL